jgi:tetratricopeptide (TPR) repeat protein
VSGIDGVRAAVTGLIGEAAAAEQVLLAETGSAALAAPGGPERWAAVPVVAHNTEFRRQQVQRLRAIRCGQEPPEFGEVDHRSAPLYAELAALPADAVGRDSWRVAGELAEEVRLVSDENLIEPDRNPWLRGRQLWLQVIVRGFWHPTGHLGEYYLSHGQPDRAVALAEHAVAAADFLSAPAAARGMAAYNLACASAGAGRLDAAAAALTTAIALNPDVRANALRDSDLAALRARGTLSVLGDSAVPGGAS